MANINVSPCLFLLAHMTPTLVVVEGPYDPQDEGSVNDLPLVIVEGPYDPQDEGSVNDLPLVVVEGPMTPG